MKRKQTAKQRRIAESVALMQAIGAGWKELADREKREREQNPQILPGGSQASVAVKTATATEKRPSPSPGRRDIGQGGALKPDR